MSMEAWNGPSAGMHEEEIVDIYANMLSDNYKRTTDNLQKTSLWMLMRKIPVCVMVNDSELYNTDSEEENYCWSLIFCIEQNAPYQQIKVSQKYKNQ
jgi:hypothetical protein